MAQLSKLKPYAIGAAVLGASIAAGIGVYHFVPGPELGFAFDWPPENGGLSDQNGGGTMVCDPPVDPCPEGSDLDTSDFTGRADPGTTVKLYRNNRATVIGETTAASDGSWTVPGVVVPEGTHTIIAEATRGDKSVTVSHTIYVDTTKPTWSEEWDVYEGVDAEAGIYLHGCGCPDWCWPAETAWTTLQPCDPGPGYQCGPGGDCHADYTAEEFEQCKASRRVGCLRVSTAQAEDNYQVRLLEVHTSTYYEAGCWRIPANSGYGYEPSNRDSTTTRFYFPYYTTPEGWAAGDVVLLEDCTDDCALAADEQGTVSGRGSNYVNLNPAASADLDDCCVHNLSRVAILDDPTGYPPWDLTVGMTIQANESTRDATVAGITGTGPWSVTFTSPFFDHAPQGMLLNAADPTDEQSDAWWEQDDLPDWAVSTKCVIPPNVEAIGGGPATCVPKDEWE